LNKFVFSVQQEYQSIWFSTEGRSGRSWWELHAVLGARAGWLLLVCTLQWVIMKMPHTKSVMWHTSVYLRLIAV